MNQSIVKISKEQLAKLPVEHFRGEIHIINTEQEAGEAIRILRENDVIGFDTETKPSFKKGQINLVSLMQLSTRTMCFLFRLNKVGMPEELRELLEDENIKKIGLSVHDDFHHLQKLKQLEPRGFIDLQSYVKDYGIADNSLTKIYAIMYGKRISKGQRLSNWEATDLSAGQQAYAALDALACIRIFDTLNSIGFDPQTSPYLVIEEDNAEGDIREAMATTSFGEASETTSNDMKDEN